MPSRLALEPALVDRENVCITRYRKALSFHMILASDLILPLMMYVGNHIYCAANLLKLL